MFWRSLAGILSHYCCWCLFLKKGEEERWFLSRKHPKESTCSSFPSSEKQSWSFQYCEFQWQIAAWSPLSASPQCSWQSAEDAQELWDERNRATVITVEVENELWAKGVLGTHSPKALLNAVFFYNEKYFLLRGVREHYNLTFAQLKLQNSPDCYTYYEYVSKNHQGGVSDSSEGKVVTIVHSQIGRSHVSICISQRYPSSKARSPICIQPLPFTPTAGFSMTIWDSRKWWKTRWRMLLTKLPITASMLQAPGCSSTWSSHPKVKWTLLY